MIETNDLVMLAHVSIILLVADCSLLLFDMFNDFLGVVSSVDREDDVLEEKAVSEGRAELTEKISKGHFQGSLLLL